MEWISLLIYWVALTTVSWWLDDRFPNWRKGCFTPRVHIGVCPYCKRSAARNEE